VFAEQEAQLLVAAASSREELDAMVARRVEGLPLEQVIGWAEFCGLRIAVDPGVFVPRRRSEFLVAHAVATARNSGIGPPVILDLCCGTGCVGLAVGRALDSAELYGVDIDPAEVACARRNVAADGQVYEGDLYDPLPTSLCGRVTLLVANAPYVPSSELGFMPAEARLHEPAVALDGGADGAWIQRRVAAGAPSWLAPGGSLLIETSERQAPLTERAVAAAGLNTQVVTSEEWATAVVIGRSAAPSARPA
jgi:release factor glutamine methyltransferase